MAFSDDEAGCLKAGGGILRDCLVNCAEEYVANFDHSANWNEWPGDVYGRGIILGAVSATMALTGCEFKEALRAVKDRVPGKDNEMGAFDEDCVPPAWLENWKALDEPKGVTLFLKLEDAEDFIGRVWMVHDPRDGSATRVNYANGKEVEGGNGETALKRAKEMFPGAKITRYRYPR